MTYVQMCLHMDVFTFNIVLGLADIFLQWIKLYLIVRNSKYVTNEANHGNVKEAIASTGYMS